MIDGMHLELVDQPKQFFEPKTIQFYPQEEAGAQSQIDALLAKKAIVQIKNTTNRKGFLSNVFLCPKKDGGFHMILNLKQFNKFVQYVHFQMETLLHILALITPGCYVAVFDLKDAYLVVPIAGVHVMGPCPNHIVFVWMVQVPCTNERKPLKLCFDITATVTHFGIMIFACLCCESFAQMHI